jgi:hypothetical protein
MVGVMVMVEVTVMVGELVGVGVLVRVPGGQALTGTINCTEGVSPPQLYIWKLSSLPLTMTYKVPVKAGGTVVVTVTVSQTGEPVLGAIIPPTWPVLVMGGL